MAKEILSQKVLQLEESATLKMSRLARELRAKGKEVISLSLGEPDFDTPAHIKQAAKEALDNGYTKYTPVSGLPELVDAVQAKFLRDNNMSFDTSQIVVSNGAKQSIYNICQALLNPGDEVVVFTPYWVSYYEIIKLSGGVPITLYAGIERDFKPSPEELDAAITPRTKFVLFSSPCNPTGSVFSQTELEAYAAVIAKHPDVYVVSDEIYEYINFTGRHVSIGAVDIIRDRAITVNGFSKGFAMTGWRLGYMGAPVHIAAACKKIQGQVTSGANSFGQRAGAYALMAPLDETSAMRNAFRNRRDLLMTLLPKIPGVKVNFPQGAFYLFPDISDYFGKSDGKTSILDADDLSEYLLTKANVATVSGAAFGGSDCLRISYAASEDMLRIAVERIGAALSELS